jgi:hypothetical protein
VTAIFSHTYSNSDASRSRMVLPPSPLRTTSSRQAVKWALVTSDGRVAEWLKAPADTRVDL